MPPVTNSDTLAVADAVSAWQDASAGFAGDVLLQLDDAGSWSGVITFQGTIDDGDGIHTIGVVKVLDNTIVSTTAAFGLYRINASGMKVRCKLTTATTGAIKITRQPTVG